MLVLILILLIVLWFLGFISLPPLQTILFSLYGHPVRLFDLVLFTLLLILTSILPGFIRFLAAILLLLLVLSFVGIITVNGFSSLITLVIIFAIVYYLIVGMN